MPDDAFQVSTVGAEGSRLRGRAGRHLVRRLPLSGRRRFSPRMFTRRDQNSQLSAFGGRQCCVFQLVHTNSSWSLFLPSLPHSPSISPYLPLSPSFPHLPLSPSFTHSLTPSLSHSPSISLLSSTVFAVCPDFSQENGNFVVTGQHFNRYTEDTRVTITCNNGFLPLENASEITCTGDGTWKPHPPTCAGNITMRIKSM